MVSLWIILVFLLLCVSIKWLMGKKSRLPPGPRGLPFIGNVHQIGTSPFVSHSEMANKYDITIGDFPYRSPGINTEGCKL